MKLMKLGTNEGIAGTENFKSMTDVLRHIPHVETWDWCDGHNEDGLHVTAVLKNGDSIKLESSIHAGDASNYVPDYDKDALPIGEQIAGLEVSALIFRSIFIDQNRSEEYEEYLPVEDPDWGKIRRRVEDALRKTVDKSTLFAFANKLNVKIY